MSRLRQSGFSALEALAAIAILAIALVPLVALQIQISRNFLHQREVRATVMLQRNAMALLRDVNMMQRPQGSASVDSETRADWSAQPLSSSVRTTRQGAGDGDFEVALYQVDVALSANNGAVSAFEFEQLGWRRIADGER